MPSKAEKPPKSNEKKAGEKKKDKSSFFRDLKGSLMGENVKKQENKKDQGSSEDANGKPKDDHSDSLPKQEKTEKEDGVPQTEKEDGVPHIKKEDSIPQEPEEDQAFYLIENFKEHETVQALRKRKNTIIKAVAIAVSVVLIIIGIIYAFSPTDQVASNVIFGERAMFSVFLIMVAFLILAAVFASRLLEGKYLKDIHQNLEIVEGKKQRDDHKNSKHDPIIKGMNKKDK